MVNGGPFLYHFVMHNIEGNNELSGITKATVSVTMVNIVFVKSFDIRIVIISLAQVVVKSKGSNKKMSEVR